MDGESADDLSGYSVSLSSDGSRVAIGAIYNDGRGSSSGHVRVYEYAAGVGWTQLGADLDGEAADDYSGYSVSLSSDGSRVAIGSPLNDGGAWAPYDVPSVGGRRRLRRAARVGRRASERLGGVRVYEYAAGSGWTQLGADLNGEAANDQFGYSVSLSSDGSRVAIGAPGNDSRGSSSGHVRVYEYTAGSGWTQLAFDLDGEGAGDRSGHSVTLSSDGSRVAIGATGNDGRGSSSGHVRVYSLGVSA